MFLSIIPIVLLSLLGVPNLPSLAVPKPVVMATHTISLDQRYADKSVNDVFKDNILLNLAYMNGQVKDPHSIDWQAVEKPFSFDIMLRKGELFAYHEDILPEYQGLLTKTAKAHFNAQEGFKSDGYLMGDGVCHLASLIYWAAKDAGLEVKAPTNHDFANIPQVPREDGVAIYFMPGQTSTNAQENLYVKNDLNQDVILSFVYDGHDLTASVEEVK